MRKIDLHIHTTASDGTLTPSAVTALAAKPSCAKPSHNIRSGMLRRISD